MHRILMKYKVHWHDTEDERSGVPIEVEADSLKAAYWAASDELTRIAPQFRSFDIELVVDESGMVHNPDHFLEL